MGRLNTLPSPDAETASSVVQSALDVLSSKEVMEALGGFAATGGSAAGVLVPMIASAYVGEKVLGIGQKAGDRFEGYAEDLDEDDRKQAALIWLLRRTSSLLPDAEEFESAAMQAADGNPDELIELLETYSKGEKRAEFDRAVKRVLSGDFESDSEDLGEHLRDTFGTNTRDEAMAMFLDLRDLLQAREVHETLETVGEIEIGVSEVQMELEETRASLHTRFDELFEARLESEGFEGLNPLYFETQPIDPPARCWRTGFSLAEVKEGYALDRTLEKGDYRRNVTEELIDALLDGEDRVVVGPPGSGKSTVCRLVACEWYERQYGTVFYRESGKGHTFESTGELQKLIQRGEDHVLVIIEDAIRGEANDVIEVVKRYTDHPRVTFLLDAREQEWRRGDEIVTDAKLDAFRTADLTQYQLPGHLDETECERLVKHFKDATDTDVEISSEWLLDDIRSESSEVAGVNIVGGEVLLLLHRLSRYANPLLDFDEGQAPNTRLEEEVQSVHERLEEKDDELGGGSSLVRRVGIVVNLLNTAGIGVHEELVHALAEDEHDHEAIWDAMDLLEGSVIFEVKDQGYGTETELQPRYRAIHESWSTVFLANLLDAVGEGRASSWFGEGVSAMISLADDEAKRTRIRTKLTGGDYLDLIADDPQEWADDRVKEIFECGMERPGLTTLFGSSNSSSLELPAACSPETSLWCVNRRGLMYLDGGHLDRAESEFKTILELAEDNNTEEIKRLKATCLGNLGLVARQRSDFDAAEDYHQQSLDLSQEISDIHGQATSLGNLGTIAQARGDLDDAEEYYHRSLDLKKEIGDTHGQATSLNNLGLVAETRGDFGDAEEFLQQSLDLFQEVGDTPGRAKSHGNLGLVAQARGDLDAAEDYHQQSFDLMREAGDIQGLAQTLGNLGLVAETRGDLGDAESFLKQSLDLSQEIGDTHGQSQTLSNLGLIAQARGELDDAENVFQQSLDLKKEIGDTYGQATSLNNLGTVAHTRGDLDDAKQYIEEATRILLGVGALGKAETTLGNLLYICKQTGDKGTATKWLERWTDVTGNEPER